MSSNKKLDDDRITNLKRRIQQLEDAILRFTRILNTHGEILKGFMLVVQTLSEKGIINAEDIKKTAESDTSKKDFAGPSFRPPKPRAIKLD